MAGGNIVGRIGIKVAPDTSDFNEKLKAKLEREKDKYKLEIPVSPKRADDFAQRLKEVRDNAQADIDAKDVKLKIGVTAKDGDLEKAAKEQARVANERLKDEEIHVPLGLDPDKFFNQLREAIYHAKAKLSEEDLSLNFKFKFDSELAKQEINHFKREIDGTKLNFKADIDRQATVRAEVAELTRNRSLSIYVRLEKRSLAVAKGAIESLFGLNLLTGTGRALEGFVTHIDRYALSFAKMGTLAATVVSTVLSSVSAISGVLSSLGAIGGYTAALPAATAAIGAFVLVNVAAFKHFGDAVKGNATALDLLPASARGAAGALRGVYSSMQRPIQDAYWKQLGGVFEDLVAKTLPELQEGLIKVGGKAGIMTQQIVRAFTEQGGTGLISGVFNNMAQGLQNANAGIRPFISGLITLGGVGATFLPKVGTYLADASDTFYRWVQRSADSGKITFWMSNAAVQAGNLGRAFVNIKGIFSALADAARGGGAGNLASFADYLGKVRNALEGPAFQDTLRTLFAGAHQAIGTVRDSLKDFFVLLHDNAPQLNQVLTITGNTVAAIIKGLSGAANNSGFFDGVVKLFEGVQRGIQGFLPKLPQIFSGLRDLGDLLGTVFANFFPIIGSILAGVSGSFQLLKDNLKDLIPILAGFSGTTVQLMITTLNLILVPVNALIGLFNKLPGAVQNALLALLLFQRFGAAGSKFLAGSTFLGPLVTGLKNAAKDIKSIYKGVRTDVATPIGGGTGTGIRPAAIVPSAAALQRTLGANLAAVRLPNGLLSTQSAQLGRSVTTRLASTFGTNLPVALRGVNLQGAATALSRQVTSPLTQGLRSGFSTAASDGLRNGLVIPRNSGIFVPTSANLQSAIRQGASAGLTGGLRLSAGSSGILTTPLQQAIRSGATTGLASGLRLPAGSTALGGLTRSLTSQIGTATRSAIQTAEQGAAARAIALPPTVIRAAAAQAEAAGKAASSSLNSGLAAGAGALAATSARVLSPILTNAQTVVKKSNDNFAKAGIPLAPAITESTNRAGTAIGGFLSKTGKSFSDMFKSIGGGWLLAIGAGFAIFSRLSSNAADLKANIDAGTQSFKDMAQAAADAGENIGGAASLKKAQDYFDTIKDAQALSGNGGNAVLDGSKIGSSLISGLSAKGGDVSLEQFLDANGFSNNDILKVMTGKGTDAQTALLKGLQSKLNDAGGSTFTRFFSDDDKSAKKAADDVGDIINKANNAKAALEAMWHSDGHKGDLITAALGAINKASGPATVDNINSITDTLSNLSTDGGSNLNTFAHTLAETLGGTSDDVDRNFGVIANTLSQYDSKTKLIAGQDPMAAIGRDLISVGVPVAKFKSAMGDFGYSADAVADAIRFQFGPATDAAGKSIQVLGENVPNLKLFSNGISEVANALSAASGVDAGKLINAITLGGYNPTKLAVGLASQGVSLENIAVVLKDLGISGVPASKALGLAAQALAQFQSNAAFLQGFSDFQKSLQDIGRSMDDTQTKADNLYAAIQQLQGNPLDKWTINSNGNKAIETAKTALQQAKEQAAALSGIDIDKQTGVQISDPKALAKIIDGVKFSFQDVNNLLAGSGPLVDTVGQAFQGLGKNMTSVAQVAFKGVIDKGGSVADAMKAATTAVDPLNTAADTLIKQLGATDAQADAIRQTFGLLPKTIVASISAETQGAEGPIRSVLAGLATVKKGGSFTVTGLTSEAEQKLRSLGLQVQHLPDGTTKVTVTGDPSQAYAALNKFLADAATKKAQTIVDGDTTLARNRIKDLDNTPVTINASLNIAVATAVAQVRSAIGAVLSVIGLHDGGILEAFANGGIRKPRVKSYANGGENHVAQIASAGSYRLWAEDETGGEAYIPLGSNKRTRSVQILEEVATRFGYSLNKLGSNLRNYADGSSDAGVQVNSGSGITVINHYPVAEPTSRTVEKAAALRANIGV